MSGRFWLVLAALSGALAIGAGAFGAHAAPGLLQKSWLQTGAAYQLAHAVAACLALVIARQSGSRLAGAAAALFVIGAFLFGGSLYLLALDAPRLVGAVTPFGGVIMILGWLTLAAAAIRLPPYGR